MGATILPGVRPGPDHAHMAPKLLTYLKENNMEKKPDKFGRRNAEFYTNHIRQEMDPLYQPKLVKKLNAFGFSFWAVIIQVVPIQLDNSYLNTI